MNNLPRACTFAIMFVLFLYWQWLTHDPEEFAKKISFAQRLSDVREVEVVDMDYKATFPSELSLGWCKLDLRTVKVIRSRRDGPASRCSITLLKCAQPRLVRP
mmetsp:Transcript_115921/g.201246  ORF Transcript_115921/g.201246 Transcript_115921/m.201246 type:complete len:103 (+) Transcript_115921:130-438(+)